MPIRSRHMQRTIATVRIHSRVEDGCQRAPLAAAERVDGAAEVGGLAGAREVDEVVDFIFGEFGRHGCGDGRGRGEVEGGWAAWSAGRGVKPLEEIFLKLIAIAYRLARGRGAMTVGFS